MSSLRRRADRDGAGTELVGWHEPDYLSLVAGLASVLAVALFLLADLTPLSVRPDVGAAVLLAAAGLAGLSAGRRRLRR